MVQSKKVFQLSGVSQNDNQCQYGADYTMTVTNVTGGSLREGSILENQTVKLPIPPAPHQKVPATPTWFLVLDDDALEATFDIRIQCSKNKTELVDTLTLSNVKKWTDINAKEKTNQIYQKGDCGIFGFATPGAPDGWIYTYTVAVTNPQVHPPGA